MDTAEHDYGRATSVDAEAIGPPGQRHFRLLVTAERGSASIWMEKVQLASIGVWFDEVIERLDREQPTGEADAAPAAFPGAFDLDFRASQIGLGYVEAEDLFAIHAFEAAGSEGRGEPFFRCFLSRGQCRVLMRKIDALVAAGRQICPLCETPIDPSGHACPKANGHRAAAT